ncbi:MAG: purine-binding chemotaxis protein CheW [Clostridiales bacterium]|nr:purine-binding chemotaxis protein CheW [Clostridiales bacterium]
MNEELYNELVAQFNTDGGEILMFTVDRVLYGVEIQYITEIIGIQPITIVPRVPSYIKGVINIRGKVVPVINVRNRFSIPEIPYDDRTCIIVVELGEIVVGLIVDRVREVITVKPSEISSTPDNNQNSSNQFIRSIIESNDEIKLLLDVRKLVME